MALDGVPWFIGGPDAEHGPNVARLLAYLAANGNEGIVDPRDLKVAALDVPGAAVKVGSGAASILNALATQEAYTVQNKNTDPSVLIAATGSSSGRSDMVIVRVDNPYVDGNAQAPADPANGPYTRFDVLVGVPSTARDISDVPGQEGTSGLALARIDLPKSTGTVTSAMITDLRKLMNPWSSGSIMLQGAPASGGSNLTGSGFAFWPDNSYAIDIPKQATHMIARLEFQGGQTAGQVGGQIRLVLGSGSDLYPFGTYSYNYPDPGQKSRAEVVAAGELKLPSSVKGTTQTLRVQGLRSSGTGNLFTVDSTYYNAQIQFVSRPA
ncbi:hypothetical protein E9228_002763 [Curtobacterium flaccumfaciens]|uniref:Tail fiber protein n=1 Tax=Curtobacterium salicis TaxID=1779862 RepID=A0ABX0T9F7_9MICO|nr:hypothetical protein [Curtobacterium sp. WW7]NII42105.1 hypothetical protein [Curtobacterium sp. WW7]